MLLGWNPASSAFWQGDFQQAAQEVEKLGVGELNQRGCVDRWTLSQG